LNWLEAGERTDIIVSDLTMPEMDGLMVIQAAQKLRPNLPAVLLTGYAGEGAAPAFDGDFSGPFSLLRKPISGAQLVDQINELLLSDRQPSSD
jgi:CheY-like chemotaxis protein